MMFVVVVDTNDFTHGRWRNHRHARTDDILWGLIDQDRRCGLRRPSFGGFQLRFQSMEFQEDARLLLGQRFIFGQLLIDLALQQIGLGADFGGDGRGFGGGRSPQELL